MKENKTVKLLLEQNSTLRNELTEILARVNRLENKVRNLEPLAYEAGINAEIC